MPLTKFQTRILQFLAAHRDPESYVAGSTPLNRSRSRFSEDVDVFHDREERVAYAAEKDVAALKSAGLHVVWLRRQPAIYSAEIREGKDHTLLEWVVDSDFRFFPTVKDELFGYVLHPIDLATNKVMAAAGRQKIADAIDLITIHDHILPLGAVIWAAVDKAPGYTPEGLIAEIRRNVIRYREEDLRAIASVNSMDLKSFHLRIRDILNNAEEFVSRMPTDMIGRLFLKDGKVVQPDPDKLDEYSTHTGARHGHWPSNTEISSAMIEYYDSRER